jgi:hypothetical protein
MGWNSGGDLMEELIKVVFRVVPSETARMNIYMAMVKAFEDHDCDVLEECMDLDEVYDQTLLELGYDFPEDRTHYNEPLVRPAADKDSISEKLARLDSRVKTLEDRTVGMVKLG